MKRFALILLCLLLLITGISCDDGYTNRNTEPELTLATFPPDFYEIMDNVADDLRDELGFMTEKPIDVDAIVEKYGENAFKVVYVSKSGGIAHESSICSGMKYYKTMYYYEAIENGYPRCRNCFRKIDQKKSSKRESSLLLFFSFSALAQKL